LQIGSLGTAHYACMTAGGGQGSCMDQHLRSGFFGSLCDLTTIIA
jgi:hypothetical protein